MNIIAWLLFGAIVGIVANLIDPRPAQGGAMGAVILGVAGAILGGLISSVIFGAGITGFNFTSFIIAVLGSLLLLLLGRVFSPE